MVDTPRTPSGSREAADTPDPIGQFLQLWQQRQMPVVRTFLARWGGNLTPIQLAAILRIDQRERWLRGERIRAEDYLRDFPEVGADAAAALDAVYGEFLLREELGETPSVDEYLQRFPQYADQLRAQVECRMAFTTNFLAGAFVAPREEGPVPTVDTPPPAKEAASRDQEDGFVGPRTTVFIPQVAPAPSHRYIVRKFHARGGIGEVWLAEDPEIGREVALKRLKKHHEHGRDRFLAEAQVTGQLEHPGIVPVHDLGVDDEGQPYYIMTFIRGRTLKEAIDTYHAGSRVDRGARKTIHDPRSTIHDSEPREVQLCRLLEVFIKVCQATAYAHSRGVIHRDLKPDNVMLGEFGETLLLDWGMAKVQTQPEGPGNQPAVHLSPSSGSTMTQVGQVMGTPSYMAPEMAAGNAADADERTDVYLLGATLYHLLTGQLPRRGSSFSEVVDLARTVPPPSPRKFQPDIPRALEAICLKAMAHRAEDRYAGALELADDVERYLAGAPVSAYREPIRARIWRWCKQHRRGLVRSLAGAAFLGLAVVATLALQSSARLHREREVRRDLKEFQHLVDERQFYTVLVTPAGERQLEYDLSRGEKAGEEALALADRLTTALRRLPALEEEQKRFAAEHHALLLLMVQEAQGRPAPKKEAIQAMLARLERAADLLGPSRGYYRLRARCYLLLGDKDLADGEERRAAGPELTATTLDHFLLAEEARAKALSLLTLPGAGPSGQPGREQLLNRAVQHYRQALQIDPQHFWSFFNLGRCYFSLNQGPEAIEALDTCVALRPDQPWGWSARGLTLGLLGRFAEGKADLEKALKRDSTFRPALLNRGILAWLEGQREDALADFDAVLQPPDRLKLIEAAYYRGQVLLEQKKRKEALEAFDLVARENPGFAPVYRSRAQVHFLQGDTSKGLADLNTFLAQSGPAKIDPQSPEGAAWRGRLLLNLAPGWGVELDQLVLRELNQARDKGFRSAELFFDLGSLLHGMGRLKEAVQSYEEALKTADPVLKSTILNTRGWLYLHPRFPPDYPRAQKDFAEVLRQDPRDFPQASSLDLKKAEAYTGLGYVWACRNNAAEAQREAARALRLGAGDYLTLHNVACIYAVLSRNEKTAVGPDAETAMTFIQGALELWQRQKKGPSELVLIRQEPAFQHLAAREDFRKLIGKEGP